MAETPPTTDAQQPPYLIEGARSGRSRCKTCRRAIAKGTLRIGVLIDGPFGPGYLWHHLKCLARARPHQVEEAYDLEAWQFAKQTVSGLPKLASLRGLADEAKQRRTEQKKMPFLEVAPTGRSRCKQCGEAIAEGSVRVVMGREVSFGNQVRTAPVKVHPGCVAAELEREDCAVEPAEFSDALRANSSDLPTDTIVQTIGAIGQEAWAPNGPGGR